MHTSTTFGAWVKHQRRALGMTQEQLALLLACSAEMVKKIEGDSRRPSLQLAELLALHLKVTAQEYPDFLALARPDLFAARPVLSAGSALRRAPLPVPLTNLIGRDQEVDRICALLRKDAVRLLTLTGTGGVGKTRLSLQVAVTVRESFPDGACFVNLAAIHDPGLLIPAIARPLGIQETNEQAARSLLFDFLQDRSLLLLLDNFEQLLSAASEIAGLLSACPGLKVLVTSRVRLHLYGEHEYVVAPLRLPDLKSFPLPDSGQLTRSPAVSLFVQRAQAARADFSLTDQNALDVAQICARLDGLPLAIELAAARIKLSTPQTLLAQLENSYLDLLSHPLQGLPARQQTMRAAIDWSYHLLSPAEQALFRRLGLFMGGCTLDAVISICILWDSWPPGYEAPTPASVSRETLALLASLIDHSLLFQVDGDDGQPRYVLLETLREYAIERLQASDELAPGSKRHAAYYLALVELGQVRYQGPEQKLFLKRIEAEQGNLRAVLLWSSSHPDGVEYGLELLPLLCMFWLGLGHADEGRLWVEKMLPLATNAHERLRARILNGAGLLAWAQSDSQYALQALQESLALFEKLGDLHGYAWVLNHLGQATQLQGDLAQAKAYYTRSLELFRNLGNPRFDLNIAWALSNLGQVAQLEGDLALAQSWGEQSLAIFRRLGDLSGGTWALYHLAELAESQDNHGVAVDLFRQSLEQFRSLEHGSGSAWSLYHLGYLMQVQRDHPQALACLLDALRLFRALMDPWGVAWSVVGLANEASFQKDWLRAARLYGAADALLEKFIGRKPPAGHGLHYEHCLAQTLARLDQQEFAAAWSFGKSVPSAQLLANLLGSEASSPTKTGAA